MTIMIMNMAVVGVVGKEAKNLRHFLSALLLSVCFMSTTIQHAQGTQLPEESPRSIPKRIRHHDGDHIIKGTLPDRRRHLMDIEERESKIDNRHERYLNLASSMSASISLSMSMMDTVIDNEIPTYSPSPAPTTFGPTTNWPTYYSTNNNNSSGSLLLEEDVSSSLSQPFYFFAIGHVPWGKPTDNDTGGNKTRFEMRQNQLLNIIPDELRNLTAYDGKFLVHLGDIQEGNINAKHGFPSSKPCPESLYQEVATAFEYSPIPTFFVPGDHAWLECINANEVHGFWEEHLFRFNEKQQNDPSIKALNARVYRSHHNPELFSFFLNDVLFIGLGLVGETFKAPSKWKGWDNEEGKEYVKEWYLNANARWMNRSLTRYENEMKAIVILTHEARLVANRHFEEHFVAMGERYSNLPILFVLERNDRGMRKKYFGLKNMVVMTVGKSTRPTPITVNVAAAASMASCGGGIDTMDVTNVFKFGIHDDDEETSNNNIVDCDNEVTADATTMQVVGMGLYVMAISCTLYAWFLV